MKTKDTFDLTSDWNYLPTTYIVRDKEKKQPESFPKKELDGLKYDDLRGLSWVILEGHD